MITMNVEIECMKNKEYTETVKIVFMIFFLTVHFPINFFAKSIGFQDNSCII